MQIFSKALRILAAYIPSTCCIVVGCILNNYFPIDLPSSELKLNKVLDDVDSHSKYETLFFVKQHL